MRASPTRSSTTATELVGSTSYYDIDHANLSVAIGYTFYAEKAQGTAVNPTAKYVLLHHAFDDCGAVRVVWHTHETVSYTHLTLPTNREV